MLMELVVENVGGLTVFDGSDWLGSGDGRTTRDALKPETAEPETRLNLSTFLNFTCFECDIMMQDWYICISIRFKEMRTEKTISESMRKT